MHAYTHVYASSQTRARPVYNVNGAAYKQQNEDEKSAERCALKEN